MIVPSRVDAVHKSALYRLLIQIADNALLSPLLYFKGGTCASMLSYLDRFSVDLDFDLLDKRKKDSVRKQVVKTAATSGFTLKQQSQKEPFFIFKYDVKQAVRNTLKVSIVENQITSNAYETRFFSEINRYLQCQTRETMVANKLVSLVDRFEKHKTIAGRDVYDIFYFLSNGYEYRIEIIEERRGVKAQHYLLELIQFIEHKVTQDILSQDLNFLLTTKRYKEVRKTLKVEVVALLRNEVERINSVG